MVISGGDGIIPTNYFRCSGRYFRYRQRFPERIQSHGTLMAMRGDLEGA